MGHIGVVEAHQTVNGLTQQEVGAAVAAIPPVGISSRLVVADVGVEEGTVLVGRMFSREAEGAVRVDDEEVLSILSVGVKPMRTIVPPHLVVQVIAATGTNSTSGTIGREGLARVAGPADELSSLNLLPYLERNRVVQQVSIPYGVLAFLNDYGIAEVDAVLGALVVGCFDHRAGNRGIHRSSFGTGVVDSFMTVVGCSQNPHPGVGVERLERVDEGAGQWLSLCDSAQAQPVDDEEPQPSHGDFPFSSVVNEHGESFPTSVSIEKRTLKKDKVYFSEFCVFERGKMIFYKLLDIFSFFQKFIHSFSFSLFFL